MSRQEFIFWAKYQVKDTGKVKYIDHTGIITPNKPFMTYLGLVAADYRCRYNFIHFLFFTDDSFQIYCCNNDWRNHRWILWGTWNLYILWTINNHLELAPAYLSRMHPTVSVKENYNWLLTQSQIRVSHAELGSWKILKLIARKVPLSSS